MYIGWHSIYCSALQCRPAVSPRASEPTTFRHVGTAVPSLASDLPALTELVLIFDEILRRKLQPGG